MRIKKALLPKEVLEMTNLYTGKEPAQIQKIKALWACGTYKKYSFYPLRKSEGYKIYYVELKELVKLADFGEMMYKKLNPKKLFTGVYERDFRIVKVLDQWNKKGYIDPPELCLNHLCKITFNDGRHRTIAAFHLGDEKIPVAVHSSLVAKVSLLISLSNTRL